MSQFGFNMAVNEWQLGTDNLCQLHVTQKLVSNTEIIYDLKSVSFGHRVWKKNERGSLVLRLVLIRADMPR